MCGVITDDGTKFEADVVIVAAGVGSKDLSGVDVIRQPGVIALTKSVCTKFNADREGVDLAGNAPRRVLVDTINEAHILQRRGGELAIGGGYLQVGGVASVSQLGRLAEKKEDEKNAAANRYPGMACPLLVFFDLDCFVWCPIPGSLLDPCSVSSLQLNCNCAIKQLQVNFSKTTDRQDLAAMHRLSWIKDSMYFLSTRLLT